MQWIPWLEALGLLAVVFGLGTAIGFGLSYLMGSTKPRRRRPVAAPAKPAPKPALVEGDTPAPAIAAPPEPHVEPVPEPKPQATPEPSVIVAPPQPATQFSLAARWRYPVNQFGTLTVTRPDQPSS